MDNFDQKLVLVEYLYSKFGADSFEDFREALNEVEEGFKADNRSRFKENLTSELEPTDWVWERIDQYDQNIGEYEKKLNENRDEDIRLKYFQYLSLLFTEIYLDLFYNHREKLEQEFNEVINDKKTELDADDLYTLEEDNLSKLAYWMATGSGKTLIMHANLWQFQKYTEQDVENILLITPDSGLTEQHLEEFEDSGIEARKFKPGTQSSAETLVNVLDIHKLSDEKGEKTYPVEIFEGDNLVFVDEGHKGAQGDTWIKYREQVIGEDGFSFEYSATFGQALSSIENEQLQNRYVKSIIVDYSFRNFHIDGFGKEYDILNLADDDSTRRNKYLTANLLSFYEQKKYYSENSKQLEDFNLEDPLWIFVGQTVNAVSGRELTKKGKVSDVEEVVRFLDRVLNERETIINEIEDIISGTEFLDEEGKALFEDRFNYLRAAGISPEEMYQELLNLVFNSSADAELNVVRLKNTEGEIGLRVGRNENYFGLVNIGSGTTKQFVDRVEENTDIVVEEQEFKGSIFSDLDSGDSDVNILIGAKRFTEGWDSYRVSNMGLMRVGRSEGAEIIQIFGRGIRLRGKDHSLKRTSHLELSESEVPENIEILERLNVFGIKADYIKEFEDQLEKEDIPTGFVTKSVETDVNTDLVDDDLKVPRKKEKTNYIEETVSTLEVADSHEPFVDLYPEVQTLRSGSSTGLTEEKNKVTYDDLNISLADWDQILIDMIDYKERSGYSNLILNKEGLHEIIEQDKFILNCPERRIKSDDLVQKKEKIEEIIKILLRSYIDNFYSTQKSNWEDLRREYQTLHQDDPELNFDLKFRIPDDDDLVEEVTDIIDASNDPSSNYTLSFDRSLYQPLFIKKDIENKDSKDRLKAPAQSLNEDEQRLVERLEGLCKKGKLVKEAIYLLRNPRNRGIGFEQGGYPDFLLWIKDGKQQKLIFMDPHSMVWEPAKVENADKVKLSKRIDKLENHLDDSNVEMHSYVISVTKEQILRDKFEDFSIDEYENHNVYLQNKGYLERILRDANVEMQ
jgi:cell division septum initiation protein DivIVA